MALVFDSFSSFLSHDFDTVIDVRSPAEFAEDHVPGAINLPALDDRERITVGTLYKQESAFRAKVVGAALVAQNAARHLQGPLADKDGAWQPLVYCWRGGQRSGSFATILQQIGWRAETVAGGYQTYRRMVNAALYDAELAHRIVLLDGNTGTAKTELLERVRLKGVQVLDLEGLANHRGSLFGSMTTPQPSQKAFESDLAVAIAGLDPVLPVVVEAESSKIGNLVVPPALWRAMLVAPRIRVSAPLVARATYLATTYHDIIGDPKVLENTLESLTYFQGKDRVACWQLMARNGNFETLAGELMEQHYDPRYAKSQQRNDRKLLGQVVCKNLASPDLDIAANEIIELVNKDASV